MDVKGALLIQPEPSTQDQGLPAVRRGFGEPQGKAGTWRRAGSVLQKLQWPWTLRWGVWHPEHLGNGFVQPPADIQAVGFKQHLTPPARHDGTKCQHNTHGGVPHSSPSCDSAVWKSLALNVCRCNSNTKPTPAGPRPSPPHARRALAVPASPGDLLLQSRGVRGVELDAETHGEGRLGCSENSDTAVTSPPALPASSPQHPAEEAARRHAGHPHARSAAYPSSASQPTL